MASHPNWRQWHESPALLTVVFLIGLVPGSRAGDIPAAEATHSGPPPATLTLDLPSCLKHAHDHAPRIGAARASLAAAHDGAQALDHLNAPRVVAPDLPVRRCQATTGLTGASAAVDLAEQETIYAVSRAYYTVLLARAQEKVAQTVINNLEAVRKTAQEQLAAGSSRDVTAADVDRVFVYQRLTEAKRIQAAQGAKRALSALKEAIGLDPCCCLNIPESDIPQPVVMPCKAGIVAAALFHRPELVQVRVFAELTQLEIKAQACSPAHRLATFALGADIHSRQVQQEITGPEYRPGAVPPEMPVYLVGHKCDRVKRAESLYHRAEVVVEVVRNLLALDAESAFYRWEEAAQQLAPAREAAETAENSAKALQKQLAAAGVKVETVLNARVLAGQARSAYNEYLYNHILALVEMERATAGSFCAGRAQPPAPLVVPPAAKDSEKKSP
jgi:hypothetical protein